MGCGSSTAAGASGSMSKDPEDFYLEHLHFKKMHVPDFDDYLTDDIAPVVNQVVDIVNEINTCIDDIKDAAVIVCGGFKADVDLEGIKDHDRVMVTLTKPDNTYPTAEEVGKLVADAKIAKAEQDLHKAHKALMTAMEKTYVKLKLDPATNALSSEAASPEVTAFSKAVADLTAAVGATYKVVVALKPAGIPSAPTVRVRLIKFKFPNPDSENYTEEPVSLFDVLKSKEAKNLYNAELTTAEALAGVTKAAKACADAGCKVTFALKKKKLVAKFADDAAEAAAQKKRKAAAKAKRAKAAKAKKSSGGGEDGEEGGGGDAAADDAGDKAEDAAGDAADAAGDAGDAAADAGGDAGGVAATDGAGDGEKAEGEGEEKKEGEEGEEKKEEEEKDEDGKPKDPKAAKKAKEEKASVLADKKAAVRKAVSAANSQLFKLNKAARNANGDINVAKALVVVFELIKKKIMKLSGKDSITGLIKVDPGFKVGMPESGCTPDVKFDLGLKVNLPEFEDLDSMAVIEKLLPGQAKLVIDTLMGVKDRLVELLPKFKELADQVEEAVKQSEAVFSDPGTKIKNAFGDGADMMKIGKTIAAATGNMKIVATEPIKVIKTMAQSVSRLGDELSAAVSEVKAAFA